MNDPESFIRSCDELLKHPELPGNTTINSVSDLSKLYINIGETLMAQQKELLANVSFEIAALIDPDPRKNLNYKTPMSPHRHTGTSLITQNKHI